MSYNFLEKKIADLLATHPAIKIILKRYYLIFNAIFFKNKTKHLSRFPLTKICSGDQSSFFGYYDKSPELGTFVLFHSMNSKTNTKLTESSWADICLYNLKTGTVSVVDSTYAFNFQQGSRLQWINEYQLVWNNRASDGHYCACLYDLREQNKKEIIKAIYDCHGSAAITLNFERLYFLDPGYGYFPKSLEKYKDLPSYSNDGIFTVDLNNNTFKLLFSLEQIIHENKKAISKNAKHCVNHLMLSPDGSRCIFILRWFTPQRQDALMMCNTDGSVLKTLSNDGMVSHCSWYDNSTVVGWFKHKNENSFYYMNVNMGEVRKVFPDGYCLEDGHPSFYDTKMLFDSYPDRYRIKKINVFNLESNSIEEIGSFFEDISFYDTTRCDLHPRWNNDGSKIYFDSVHEGKRYLYFLELKKQ
jgi:hypothetical protein